LDGFLKTTRIKDVDHPHIPAGQIPENHYNKDDE
jgi:hypothetical protein